MQPSTIIIEKIYITESLCDILSPLLNSSTASASTTHDGIIHSTVTLLLLRCSDTADYANVKESDFYVLYFTRRKTDQRTAAAITKDTPLDSRPPTCIDST